MAKEMTKHQREYAIGRVKGLRDDAIRRIKEKHPVVPDSPCLENSDEIRLVRSGQVKMFPVAKTSQLHGYMYLHTVFDFGPIKAADKEVHDAKKAKILKARGKETDPIYAEAMKIIDKLMLGDATEALKLIEGFAKMCK